MIAEIIIEETRPGNGIIITQHGSKLVVMIWGEKKKLSVVLDSSQAVEFSAIINRIIPNIALEEAEEDFVNKKML